MAKIVELIIIVVMLAVMIDVLQADGEITRNSTRDRQDEIDAEYKKSMTRAITSIVGGFLLLLGSILTWIVIRIKANSGCFKKCDFPWVIHVIIGVYLLIAIGSIIGAIVYINNL